MRGGDVLDLNGDFSTSPLQRTVRDIHAVFTSLDVPYAVAGGMAVVRSGAVRTTVSVDVLATRDEWRRVIEANPAGMDARAEHAVDLATGVEIDVLFPGDDWEMDVPVPEPGEVREYDRELGAWYVDLPHLIEWKTAVYKKKLREDGIEIAAKDLADVVALIQSNRERIDRTFVEAIHPAVREELDRIRRKVT
jgi:hypothetical protein